ncbi:cytochrome bo3 quinol oxidase subunit 2 [Nitrosomonas eutropha]|uniref:Cytochrome bo3 quinol oxidase subunit 2 n=1 Tax=Nitrosomonas eutropha TaxID=916 RepID=A0A1I7HYX6_9PROT|nr:cytochrome ubiquinol oxidase subunit II [Nitrosomonas eutropha]SFU65889.1 cytochrome bo3 quinol oxidase subunit 2 [Nitrosomonas eutropha]
MPKSIMSVSVLQMHGCGSQQAVTLSVQCVALVLLSGCNSTEHLSFLNPQGPIATAQSEHFWLVVAILFILIALPVFIGTVWIAWRYRYGATKSKYVPRWKIFKPLEYFSWGIPITIVIFLSILVWEDTERFDPYRPLTSSTPATHVQVIGYDWKWLFVYPEQGIASVGMLAFPAGQPLTMELTSATVMQSFFIPALGSQIYAMGGMVTQLNLQADRPGRFLGENTMYSGDGFHQQKFAAVAMTQADFDAWVQQVRATGIPFDATALNAIAMQGTKAQLRTVLAPAAPAFDSNIYFTGAKANFFTDLVMSVMDDKPLPSTALAPAITKGQ